MGTLGIWRLGWIRRRAASLSALMLTATASSIWLVGELVEPVLDLRGVDD
jgi:hypothetical protein